MVLVVLGFGGGGDWCFWVVQIEICLLANLHKKGFWGGLIETQGESEQPGGKRGSMAEVRYDGRGGWS